MILDIPRLLAGPTGNVGWRAFRRRRVWRGVVGVVFEKVIIMGSAPSVQLIPREGYEGVV